jgi:hypothetical protein
MPPRQQNKKRGRNVKTEELTPKRQNQLKKLSWVEVFEKSQSLRKVMNWLYENDTETYFTKGLKIEAIA